MDKEYIKECEEFKEMQKKYACYEKTARETTVFNDNYITYDEEYGDLGDKHFVWLPRIEGLFKMLGDRFRDLSFNNTTNEYSCGFWDLKIKLRVHGKTPELALIRAVKSIKKGG